MFYILLHNINKGFVQWGEVFPLPIDFRPNLPQQLHHHVHKTI